MTGTQVDLLIGNSSTAATSLSCINLSRASAPVLERNFTDGLKKHLPLNVCRLQLQLTGLARAIGTSEGSGIPR